MHAQQPDIFIFNSNLINDKSISVLAESYLKKNEMNLFNKRKKQQAQKEYIATRTIIKQYFSALLSLPFSSLSVLFDDNCKLLKVYHDNTALPVCCCISHSSGYVAVAVTQTQCKLGIDLERVSKKRNLTRIANQYFHTRELEICKNRNERSFYRLWTLKEALAKATCRSIVQILSENIFEYDRKFSLRSGHIDTFDLSIICDHSLPPIIDVQYLSLKALKST